ncbi:hypothetical protein P9112_005619 [Eukaryota sp. TZLM1-RC]
MSFRQLKSLSEHLRSLGFPKHVHTDCFRTPNFNLLAQIAVFLAKRLDPSSSIPQDTETESDRIFLVKSFTQIAFSSASVKLNPSKLYSSDLECVPELLKVSNVCYNALRLSNQSFQAPPSSLISTLTAKLDEIKMLTTISVDVPSRVVKLMNLVEKEEENAVKRRNVAVAEIDIARCESLVRNSIQNLATNTRETKALVQNYDNEIKMIDEKVKNRKTELERSQKRLNGLKTVRPSFMDDLIKLQDEIRSDYDQYVTLHRNLHCFENEVSGLIRTENNLLLEQQRKLKKLKSQHNQTHLKHLREDSESDRSDILTSEEDDVIDDVIDDNDDALSAISDTVTRVHGSLELLDNQSSSEEEPSEESNQDLIGDSSDDAEFLNSDDDDVYLYGDSMDEGI